MSSINVFENNSDLYEEWFEKNNDILDSEVEAIKCLLPPSGEGIEIGKRIQPVKIKNISKY